MEQKQRAECRRQFTKKCNALEIQMASAASHVSPQLENIIALMKSIKIVRTELDTLDKIIMKEALTNLEEDKLEKESDEIEKYIEKWLLVETKYEHFLESVERANSKSKNKTSEEHKRSIRLPKLEVQKFDGSLKTWLPFWAQFKKIDEDRELDPGDKFVYLLQCISPDSEARQLVESYPLTAENYSKCIDHLKSRYAREDLQTQLYVRELLSLIINKDKYVNLTSLYDSISAQLRALETLGVTKKNAAFILPMVESILPEDTLKAWQRLGKHSTEMDVELTNLLSFLQIEVENNQRIEMARNFQKREDKEESQPTASCLLTTSKEKLSTCIWCDKTNHLSMECYKLHKLTVQQRREVILKKRACTICLKRGHFYKNCKSYIKCLICSKRHSTILCAEQKQLSGNPKEENMTITASSASSSTTCSPVTILQTLQVELEYNGKKLPVRALIDNGSMKTYIKEDIIKKLQVPAEGREVLAHSLFGGQKMDSKSYNRYQLKMNSIDGTFSTVIKALGQKTVCSNVPIINKNVYPNLYNVLKAHQIVLTDNLDDIGLLIGANISGKFMTGEMIELDGEGLVALKTKLGWTVQGQQIIGH